MFFRYTSSTAIAAVLFALAVPTASAQDTTTDDQSAEACLSQIGELGQRMNEDQFWFSGWGTGGYGMRGQQMPATPPPSETATTATEAPADSAPTRRDPRGDIAGIDTPRHQIGALYSAARVLAHRGDAEGCAYLAAKMGEVYDGYVEDFEEAGVDPASVTTWRQEQIALAEPLAESGGGYGSYRIDALTGSDVRNLDDENLGSVSDVILDPESGEATYVVVARGGFLGIGEDHYAIPFDQVRATPGLELIVVDMAEAEIEDAPDVDPDRLRNPQTIMDERRRTDEFWTQRS